KRTKLESKAIKCTLIGYQEGVGYRLYDPRRRTILISRDIKFLEGQNLKNSTVSFGIAQQPLQNAEHIIIKVQKPQDGQEDSTIHQNRFTTPPEAIDVQDDSDSEAVNRQLQQQMATLQALPNPVVNAPDDARPQQDTPDMQDSIEVTPCAFRLRNRVPI